MVCSDPWQWLKFCLHLKRFILLILRRCFKWKYFAMKKYQRWIRWSFIRHIYRCGSIAVWEKHSTTSKQTIASGPRHLQITVHRKVWGNYSANDVVNTWKLHQKFACVIQHKTEAFAAETKDVRSRSHEWWNLRDHQLTHRLNWIYWNRCSNGRQSIYIQMLGDMMLKCHMTVIYVGLN